MKNWEPQIPSRKCNIHGLEQTLIRQTEEFAEALCEECINEDPQLDGDIFSVEAGRVKAIKNMEAHYSLYSSWINSLNEKRKIKEKEMLGEMEKIDEMIKNNQKIVLDLVESYFKELKSQWLNTYFNPAKRSIRDHFAFITRVGKKKLSKVKKLIESFKDGDFEADLLSYALEKDVTAAKSRLEKRRYDSERVNHENFKLQQVVINMNQSKIQDFFYSLQEMVDFSLDTDSERDIVVKTIIRNEDSRETLKELKNIKYGSKFDITSNSEGIIDYHNEEDSETLISSNIFLNSKRQATDSKMFTLGEHEKRVGVDYPKNAERSYQRSQDSSQHIVIEESKKNKQYSNVSYSSEEADQDQFSDEEDHEAENSKSLADFVLQGSKEETLENEVVLHYFQPRSSKLHMIYVNGGQVSHQIKNFGTFQAPRYHKSLLTHDDVIMMTGGFDDDLPSKSCYLMDLKSQMISEIASLNMGRTGHLMISHKGFVYVIGGVGDLGSTTSSCEIFDPQSNSWSQISELIFPTHSSCATSFSGCIYKFGGKDDDGNICSKIERYNGKSWDEISFDYTVLKLYSSSLVFPLSSTQLMIVGGTLEEYESKTDETYILELQKTGRSFLTKKGPILPVPEGFWSHQVSSFRGSIYMLQNVAHKEDPNCVLLDRRRVISIAQNTFKWSVLESN